MPVRDESNRTVLHGPEVAGSIGWYWKGCRCVQCRAANAAAALQYRKRKAMKQPSRFDRVSAAATIDAVRRMRDAGMVWEGIQSLVGVDRRDLQRVLRNGAGGTVTRRTEELVLDAAQRLAEQPGLVDERRKSFMEGPRLRWMVNCLQARGWTSEWIGREVGWHHGLSSSVLPSDRVTAVFWGRVEGVFKAYHTEWGPSRLGAVRSWRAGKFPSDCYDTDMDVPVRYLPVPGSLHPDLVAEAATFGPQHAHRRNVVLGRLHHYWGQWEKESCASAALRGWQAVVSGVTDDDGDGGVVCRLRSHRHRSVPVVWDPYIGT